MTEMMTLNHVECLEHVIAPCFICDFRRGFQDATNGRSLLDILLGR